MKSKHYKLALFGQPVNHSLSPAIHQQFASQFDLSIQYYLIDVGAQHLENKVLEFFKSGGYGANVTLPYKQQVMKYVKYNSKLAQQAQAVNTIYCDENNFLRGDNTDGIGFINDLKKRCDFDCQDKKILILGAGGATQGIVPAILLQSPKAMTIANRTLKKAQNIAVSENSLAVTFDELNQLDESFDLIIHSSSLGHQGKTLEFLPHHFHDQTLCYDLSYAKAALPFMEFCHSIGVQSTCDGLGMLIEQAACAFYLWFGLQPNTDDILRDLCITIWRKKK